jgi:ubiquitin-protein ligase
MSTVSSSSSSRSASKRLLRELATWGKEAPAETGIERLGPVSEDELLHWEAVINGKDIGSGYDGSFCPLSLDLSHSIVLTLLRDVTGREGDRKRRA